MRTVLIWIVALLLAGCSAPAAPAATPSGTPVPTTAATATSTPAPSPTLAPPTAKALPTPTPTLLPTRTPAGAPSPTPVLAPLPPVTLGQEVALNTAGRAALAALEGLPGYEIRAEIDAQSWTVSGELQVVYTHRQPEAVSELYFNLYPNAPSFGGEMTVSEVTVDGRQAAARYESERRTLAVPLDAPLAPGARASIGMRFAVRVPQLDENRFQVLVYSRGILSLAGWYPSLAVPEGERNQVLDQNLVSAAEPIGEIMLAESAFYTVHLTAPANLVLATTGVQVGEEAQGDRRTVTYRSGPSRTFYVSASADYQVLSGQVGEVTVHSVYLSGHEHCGQWVLESAQAALDLYGQLYGPYPFAEFKAIEGDQWYQGMEWPGAMVLGTMFYGGDDPVCGEWFVAHEVAHQWWYNVVGNDPVADPWLDEALAQYSAMLYYRKLWPAAAAQAYIQPIIYDRYAPYADRAESNQVGQPATAFADRKAYYAVVYARGAMFLEALHDALGEDAFFDAMRQYYAARAYQVATPGDLREIVRQADPRAVDALWAEWVEARP